MYGANTRTHNQGEIISLSKKTALLLRRSKNGHGAPKMHEDFEARGLERMQQRQAGH
jgi:hypothetical protein